MRKTIGPAFTAAACAVLAACAQPAPIQPLPLGPTPDEVADYARAQTRYRFGLASGNGDVVVQATNTFSLIASEILSRQDPSLFDAQVVCQRYQAAGPQYRRDTQTSYDPQFVQDCQRISWRYNIATMAIRRDLEARIAAADRASIAQGGGAHP